jgi:hypothetical protein
MEIWETPVFTRQVCSEYIDDEDRRLQVALVENPELGRLIPGTGGLRKVRWNMWGRGKRGGMRVIYYWAVSPEVILMLFLYPKNVQDDLTADQKRALRRVVEEAFGRHAVKEER